jgi:hypothetical protein
LVRIDRTYEHGQRSLVYQKRQKGQTFQSIRKEAVQKLVAAITARLAAAHLSEKIYALELNYQKVSQHFPPYLIPIPESYRLALANSLDPEDRWLIYCPIPEKGWFYALDDPAILGTCQLLEQEIQAGEKWDTATAILREIAAQLTRQDWTGIVDVTPDFVAYALDPELEGDQMVEVLRSSVSQKQINEWKAKGWL